MFITSIAILFSFLLGLLFFRKRLNLVRVKFVYGKYSFEYQKLFKSYSNGNPHPYCFKDELLQHIQNLRKSSQMQVQGIGKEWIGKLPIPENLTPKELLENQGEPICFNALKDKYYDLILFGYPIDLFQSKGKLVYYFFKKQLFAMDLIFEDFSEAQAKNLLTELNRQFGMPLNDHKTKLFVLPNKDQLLYTNTGFRISLKLFQLENNCFAEVMNVFDNQQNELRDQIENKYFTAP
ncbi:MAG: hypothetical protein JW729_04575 [Bacteroidales bacterium]|nr:hypothetical protein [Bacteroidales bacterium]